MTEQPLILTLKLDKDSQAFFEAQRKKYFPPERNWLEAHLMLFHQLPNDHHTRHFLNGFIHELFVLQVTGLMNLGAGVAYRVESPALSALQRELSRHFAAMLIPQDRQGFRPHITIMNKTTPEEARELITDLSVNFESFAITAIGFDLWTSLGGPWRHE